MSTALTTPPAGGATFLNAPLAGDLAALDAHVAVLGIPYGVPYGMAGVAGPCSVAPAALRAQSLKFGYERFIEHYDFDLDGPLLDGRDLRIVDCGDVAADPLDIPGNSARATAATRQILARGTVPVMLGGDDSAPIPFFRGFEEHGPLTLVQVDAHLDFRDELDGVREGYSSPIRRASEMPWVAKIVQVGLRGVGSARPGDVQDARDNGNLLVTAGEVRRQGVEWLLGRIPSEHPYLITIDLDGLDPSVAPGVTGPAPGGLRYDELADLLTGLAARGRIAGLDVVEYAPEMDINGHTALVATRLILTTIGAMARSGQLD
ncbi:MAG TPA: agmatinase [Thermomicrobiales bacterium]|nr:agmatinase [Thermomicrobiales bacterium]